MVSRRRLNAFAVSFVAMLIVQAILTYVIVPDYRQSGYTQSIGNGMIPGEFIGWGVRTENGNNLNMEVSVPEGYLIDVYFMSYDDYMQMASNHSFEFIPAASQMNVSHFSTAINMDPSIDIYDIVIVGHESNPGNPTFTLRLVQSHFPAQLLSVVQLGQFISIYSVVLFFFLVTLGYRENSLNRSPYVKTRPKTKWNNFYMQSAYATLALFTVQMTMALVMYWIVIGPG